MNRTPDPIEIVVSSDFICPWCWVGHRRLFDGIKLASLESAPQVRYSPFEINPNMPPEGMSRREYRSKKVGSWARSQAMDAEVHAAGAPLGLHFDFARLEQTPNTHLAHRLMTYAQAQNAPAKADALFDSIFAAYFRDVRDIGSIEVLVPLAEAHGFDPVAVRALLARPIEADPFATNTQAPAAAIRSLPTVWINGAQVSGAQPAEALADALRAAEGKTKKD
jgi:predicted DsbA family dithiol-disulfide isomerase